jgi:hypothetical protein
MLLGCGKQRGQIDDQSRPPVISHNRPSLPNAEAVPSTR